MDRAKLAKSNLKKSVFFGGSIGLVAIGGGLGVAIPTYYKIQKELNRSIKSASDISVYMSQLANKLGVSPDTEFTQELQGGYELVYQNGETKIFKREGDSRALVMNMNKDGSVGSAAQMSGPAALGMIQIVSSAAQTLHDSADSMQKVLGPFAKQTEDTSVKIESAVTGKSPAELLARNALANPDAAEAEKALETLKASNPEVKALPADKMQEVRQGVATQQEDMQKAEKMTAEQLAEQRAKELADYQAKLVEINKRLKAAYKDGVVGFYKAYKGKTNMQELDLSQTEKDQLDFILKKTDETAVANWVDDVNTKVEEVKDTFSAAKNAMVVIEALAAARARQAQEELKAAKDNDDIISRIASKLDSFLNAYVRTFGYNNTSDKNDAEPFEPNTGLRGSLVSKVRALGMTSEAVEKLDKEIKRLLELGEEGSEKPTSKLTFSVEVNTFNEANPDYSRLVVLRAIKTHYEPNDKFTTSSEYCIALSGERNFLDLNKIKFINEETYGQDKSKAIETSVGYIVQLIKSDSMLDLKNKGIKILKDEANQSILKGVSNPVYFDQLVGIAKKIVELQIKQNANGVHNDTDAQTPILRQYLTEWILKLADEYLFSGRDISFQAQSVIALADKVLKLDKPTLPHSTSSIYQLDSIGSSYGEWMKKLQAIFVAPTDKQINDRVREYQIFSEGIDVLESLKQDNIQELVKRNDGLYDELLYGKGTNGIFAGEDQLHNLFVNSTFQKFFVNDKLLNCNWDRLAELKDINVLSTNMDLVIHHIDELNKMFDDSTKQDNLVNFIKGNNWEALKGSILDTKLPNLTNYIGDMLRYSSGNKDFDVTSEKNQEKMKAASGVSDTLSNIFPDNANVSDETKHAIADVQDKMTVVMTSKATESLSSAQFQSIVDYTKTIFDVVPDKTRALNKLQEVLGDPSKIVDNLAKIEKFNQWVVTVKTNNNGQVSRSLIEKYVWTQEIHSENYSGATPSNGDIVSATLVPGKNGNPDKTIIIRHAAGATRPVWEITSDKTTTTFTEVQGVQGMPSTTNEYISSQTTDGRYVYFMDLFAPAILYRYEVTTKIVTQVTLSTAPTTDQSHNIGVRSMSYSESGWVYFAVADDVYTYRVWVGNPSEHSLGFVQSQTSIPSGFKNSWGMGSAHVGTSDVVVYGVYSSTQLGIYVDGSGPRSSFIDLTSYFKADGVNPSNNEIVAIISGDYDANKKTQTFFVVGTHGSVVKVALNIETGVAASLNVDGTFLLLSNQHVSDVRGATYAHGAITTFSASKAVYIADKSSDLQSIFNYLLP